jgi:general secretion pathway protein A
MGIGGGGLWRERRAYHCAAGQRCRSFAPRHGGQATRSNKAERRPICRDRFFAITAVQSNGVDRGSLMYEAYYGLREKPFSILPDPNLIYWGRTHRMAFSMLEFGVMNNAQCSVITGDVGSGKTTLIRHLLRKFNPKTINVGVITNTPRGREELLQSIMLSLNLPFEGIYPALLKRFHDFLYAEHANGRRTILIVDEAQSLEEAALEGLRMLTNINVDKNQFLQLILVGQPQLKDMLCRPQLLQFA